MAAIHEVGEPAALLYHSATVDKIDAGDAILAVRRFGSGPALLFVHGFPLSGFTWRRVLPTLSSHYTCIVVDLAGMGDSAWSDTTDFSWEGHARRLKLLGERLSLPSYHLIAQDTGATIARCLALVDGPRVDKLVLINTEIPGHRPPWIPFHQWLLRIVPGAVFCFQQLLRTRWFVRSSMGFGGCFCDPELLEGDFRSHFIKPVIDSALCARGMARYLTGLRWDTVDGLRERHAYLRMPTLLVWGQQDPTFPIALAQQMSQQLPSCRGLVPIPSSKLLPHEEQPNAVTDAVLPFLSS